jgi:tetratricopeptide (TPR) repeat protein
MKRISLILLLVGIVGFSYAQKKPNINKAETLRKQGKLDEAKDIIDQAVEFDKTMNDGKTWYYRGLIYAALDTTSNPAFQRLASNPLQTAMAAFKKAESLQKGNSEYYTTDEMGFPQLKSQQMEILWGTYLNRGVTNFQEDELVDAVKNFEKCIMLKPEDTTGYIYAGLASQINEDYTNAEKHFSKLIDLNFHSKDVYNGMIFIADQVKEDKELALKYAQMAKAAFPKDTDYPKYELNYLLALEKACEARDKAVQVAENEKTDANLWFYAGMLHEACDNNLEKAEAAYKRSLEIEPNNFNSNFNIGVLYYNSSREISKKRNALGYSAADNAKAKEYDNQIKEVLRKVIPFWERCHIIQPEDVGTLENLLVVYQSLNNKNKVTEVTNKLKALGYDPDAD